ncbi:ATP-binding cassette sub-family C member 9-like [Antedon mediterranea]|uniref:ATP-binding cassette sub-family C member 9-like n=1 Tax=Antedon mediterranea TaxID=105859 RepID=UPI003AF9272A
MFDSDDWFCGQNESLLLMVWEGLGNISSINDPCFVDGYYLIISAIFGSLTLLVLSLLYTRSSIRSIDHPYIIRYPRHRLRWTIGLTLCHTQLTSVAEGILTAVSNRSGSLEHHLYLPQMLALVTIITMLAYYHHMEAWNIWYMVFLPLLYWVMGLSSEIIRFMNIQQDPNNVDSTMRWLMCLINLILFIILTVIEIHTTLNLLFYPSRRPKNIAPINLRRQGMDVKFVQGHTNLLSGLLFWWMNDLVKLGSKQSLNPDDFGDLPRSLTAGLNSTELYNEIYDIDEKDGYMNMTENKPSIFRGYRRIYGFGFLESALTKAVADALSFVPALAVGGMVDYVIRQNIAESLATSNPVRGASYRQ